MTFHLETGRLILRSFEERDIAAFQKYRSDPDVARYQGWDIPYTLDLAISFVDEMKNKAPGQPGEWYQIALELRSGREMIGDCVFQILTEDIRQAEIGFTLALPFQGKGYATEAVICLLGYLFGELGLHRVRANVDPRNQDSIKLLEKVGMRHEGRFIESLWLKGEWVDEDWYAVLCSEWLVLNPK